MSSRPPGAEEKLIFPSGDAAHSIFILMSVRSARVRFMIGVRCLTSRPRIRCGGRGACCSLNLVSTKRILGRVTSQITSASFTSIGDADAEWREDQVSAVGRNARRQVQPADLGQSAGTDLCLALWTLFNRGGITFDSRSRADEEAHRSSTASGPAQ